MWKTSGSGWPVSRQYVADGPDAADAEQHLLEQPVLAAAAVEPVGHLALAEVVLLDVGVEHAAAAPGRPGPARSRACSDGRRAARGRSGGGAVVLAQQGDRQLVGVEDRVVLLLPAVPGERLAEVAVPVEQSHADQRDAQVAGRLEMVAGEDAEAAGVLRQGGGDAELG